MSLELGEKFRARDTYLVIIKKTSKSKGVKKLQKKRKGAEDEISVASRIV